MKCPYTFNIEQIYQDSYEYSEGQTVLHQNKLIETREYIDCMLDQCAVYVNGTCQYYKK